jgi:hypothetical protein
MAAICVQKAVSLVHRQAVEEPVNPPFPLGQVVATPAALKLVPPDLLQHWLQRHQTGDWGAVCPEDWAANDRDLIEGNRLLSAYLTPDGTKVWIITEWDRSVTTVLLPEEY